MENNAAVHPIGNKITGDIAQVESQVIVGDEKRIKPGQQCAVKGIYAANDQEEKKGPGKKMMTDLICDFFECMQICISPFGSLGIIPYFWALSMFWLVEVRALGGYLLLRCDLQPVHLGKR